jgi:hypothetical protein
MMAIQYINVTGSCITTTNSCEKTYTGSGVCMAICQANWGICVGDNCKTCLGGAAFTICSQACWACVKLWTYSVIDTNCLCCYQKTNCTKSLLEIIGIHEEPPINPKLIPYNPTNPFPSSISNLIAIKNGDITNNDKLSKENNIIIHDKMNKNKEISNNNNVIEKSENINEIVK